MSATASAVAPSLARTLLIVMAGLVGGCVSFVQPTVTGQQPLDPAQQSCLTFYGDLDAAVDAANRRDGGEYRIPGFPYLRTDRFTASFRGEVRDPKRYAAWVDRMQQIDAAARRVEIANLPESALGPLRPFDRQGLNERVDICGRSLARAHAGQALEHERLVERARVPDDYQTWRRAAGLYPLTGMAVASSIRTQQAALADSHGGRGVPSPATGHGAVHRYSPMTVPASDSRGDRSTGTSGNTSTDESASLSAERAADDVALALARAPRDPLGVPAIDTALAARLFDHWAPVLDIATNGDYDRIGRLQWLDLEGLMRPGADRFWLGVDTSAPTVYRRLAYTRLGDEVLTQLVYTMWFPDRPAQDSNDLGGGRLDTVVWRVTLDSRGRLLMFDALQGAGFLHAFYPSAQLRARPRPPEMPIDDWAFVPEAGRVVDADADAQRNARWTLHLHSRNHLLVNVTRGSDEPVEASTSYQLADDSGLRQLSLPTGGSRSVYDSHGLIGGTERAQRWLLWVAGVPSVGSQRQWGRQPTALVGRRHFDDADLIERRFERVE